VGELGGLGGALVRQFATEGVALFTEETIAMSAAELAEINALVPLAPA